MSTITKSIDLNVPVRTAYNQWTQFEEFPNFMEGITEVTQLDDEHLHWKANIAGKKQNGLQKSQNKFQINVSLGLAEAP
jgi:uncharacterized membrane protein